MTCRGLRGATTVDENTSAAILAATDELLQALVAANNLQPEDIASALFTTTPDLTAAFPARAARTLGWTAVPLLDAAELPVPGSLTHCIRVLIHWNTARPPEAVRHVYLHAAASLRPDLTFDPAQAQLEMNHHRGEEANMPKHPTTDTSDTGPVAGIPAVKSGDDGAPGAHTGPLPASPGRKPVAVAYQGEPGAYSQAAIFQHFGAETDSLPCRSFEEIFAAVEENRVTYGLLPVENSQTGSIHQSYDLLLEHDLRVAGEVKYRVSHCLLAPAGTTTADVQRVRSHPQALAQVERYLRRRGWQAVPGYDTAGSARELAANPEPGTAALASALAGQIYHLEVLDSGVEDAPDNTTRFFVLSRDSDQVLPRASETASSTAPELGIAGARLTKTSLVFATAHTPGALHRALGEFATRGLNLSKIESRPRHNRPWHYVFYLDFEGHYQDPAVAQALVALLAHAAFVKLLGSYPAAVS
jgi:monofunctional chorismate mutase